MAISPTFESDVVEFSFLLSRDQKTQPADFEPSPGNCGGGATSSGDAVEGAWEGSPVLPTFKSVLSAGTEASAIPLLALWSDGGVDSWPHICSQVRFFGGGTSSACVSFSSFSCDWGSADVVLTVGTCGSVVVSCDCATLLTLLATF